MNGIEKGKTASFKTEEEENDCGATLFWLKP